MTLPTLYKRTQTGAIQQWTIHAIGPVIKTVYGQVGGALQDTNDLIGEGKNAGRANATTPLQQAQAEAQAKWTKQKKKGYVEDIEAAKVGEVDDLIEGGVPPMLAPNKSWPKDKDLERAIIFPCYFQPKLDGMRMVAVIENGRCTPWSRTRKRINSVPHIVEALETRFKDEDSLILDGELYNHEFKDSFEDLISILRKDEPDAEGLYKQAQYHVYDMIEWSEDRAKEIHAGTPFIHRHENLAWLMEKAEAPLFLVPTLVASTLEDLRGFYEASLEDGYEGGMARNASAPYESGKRSKHLQKMKEFEDHEFVILGVNDGRGKDAGTVATFNISLPCLCCGKGTPCVGKARLKGTYARRRELMQKPELWQNKKLTVTLKRWTADGMPYLPIAKAVRDYE